MGNWFHWSTLLAAFLSNQVKMECHSFFFFHLVEENLLNHASTVYILTTEK